MQDAHKVRGTLDESGTLRVLEPVPLPPGEVEVTIRPLSKETIPKHSVWDVVKSCRFGRSDEELVAELKALRDEWER